MNLPWLRTAVEDERLRNSYVVTLPPLGAPFMGMAGANTHEASTPAHTSCDRCGQPFTSLGSWAQHVNPPDRQDRCDQRDGDARADH